jgi:O-antigen/teichoic acid export membrane protein
MIAVLGTLATTAVPASLAIPVWLGEPFRAASLVCGILVISHFVNLAGGMYSNVVRAMSRPELEIRYLSIATILNLLLTLLLAPLLGLVGVALATAIALAAATIWFLRHVRCQPAFRLLPSPFEGLPVTSAGASLLVGGTLAVVASQFVASPSLVVAVTVGLAGAVPALFAFVVGLGRERRRLTAELAREAR